MNIIEGVLAKKAAEKPKLAEFAECESSWANGTTPIHLRRTEGTELHKGGGLNLYGITALCGTEVSWDMSDLSRERIISALPNQHTSFRFCTRCLVEIGIEPVPVK